MVHTFLRHMHIADIGSCTNNVTYKYHSNCARHLAGYRNRESAEIVLDADTQLCCEDSLSSLYYSVLWNTLKSNTVLSSTDAHLDHHVHSLGRIPLCFLKVQMYYPGNPWDVYAHTKCNCCAKNTTISICSTKGLHNFGLLFIRYFGMMHGKETIAY